MKHLLLALAILAASCSKDNPAPPAPAEPSIVVTGVQTVCSGGNCNQRKFTYYTTLTEQIAKIDFVYQATVGVPVVPSGSFQVVSVTSQLTGNFVITKKTGGVIVTNKQTW